MIIDKNTSINNWGTYTIADCQSVCNNCQSAAAENAKTFSGIKSTAVDYTKDLPTAKSATVDLTTEILKIHAIIVVVIPENQVYNIDSIQSE